nr:transposase, MuDR, MULE transposase domain protein [Tanacetum cinerariifolium]
MVVLRYRLDSEVKLEDVGFKTWSKAMCPANRYNYMTSKNDESINKLTRHVDDRRRVHRVDLNTRSCSCRKWQLSGIPCGHVIAVARVMGWTDCNELALEYEYEAAYNNNNGRSQEYARANNNNYRRTQEYEYEATYNNNNRRSQEYARAYNNSYGRSQEYAGAYFNAMYDQPNNMGFAFKFGQSSQQINSTWDHVNLADP